MKLLKQATYMKYAIGKLSKFVQIRMLTSTDLLYRGFFENKKGPGTSFQATFFLEFFKKRNCFVILHKLAKCDYQTVFTSHAWAFDGVMIFEYLKS